MPLKGVPLVHYTGQRSMIAYICGTVYRHSSNFEQLLSIISDMMSNMAMMHQNRPHNPVESSEIHYNQNMNIPPPHNPHVMPMASNYYERTQTYKRKNDFGDGSTYRSDKIMRTSSYNMVHAPKDNEYDMGLPSDKPQVRHYQPSGSGTDTSVLPRGFDRHNLGSSDGK